MNKRLFALLVVIAAVVFIGFGNMNFFAEKAETSFLEEDLLEETPPMDFPSDENDSLVDEVVEQVQETEEKTDNVKDKVGEKSNNTTDNTNGEEKFVVTNTDDILVLVNKRRNLPADYKPSDLVVPNVRFSFKEKLEKRYLRKEAALALEELFNEAEKEGIILYAVSGYRSYNTQKTLFENKVKKVGFEAANLLVAYPGQSEHQTGLAMDVSCQSVGFTLEEDFGQTTEGIWLSENAHKFGFIIRYGKDTTNITGYSYEPWHIRYVGKDAAKEIYDLNITLEEYLGDVN